MTAWQFKQPWLSELTGEKGMTAAEFANLRTYLKGLDDGTIPLFNLNAINATIGSLTVPILVGDVMLFGNLTFSPTTKGIKGTTTNDNVATGNVGEYITSAVTNVSAVTSNNYGDATSISLTAGDWDVSVNASWEENGSTWSGCEAGAGTVSGNTAPGNLGDAYTSSNFASTSIVITRVAQSVPPIRFSFSNTTTVYLKFLAIYTVGTPKFYGRISARRVR